jgi:hypothetical protein
MDAAHKKERRMAQATLRTAMALGNGGRPQDGRSRLAAGLARMEMLESLGLKWAEELTLFYRDAIRLYGRVYLAKTSRPQSDRRVEIASA